jgi:hypothetical protein
MSSSFIVRVLSNLRLFSIFDRKVEFFVHSSGLMILLDKMMDLDVTGMEFLLGLPGGLLYWGIEPLNEYEFLALLVLNVEDFLGYILFFRIGYHSSL